MRNMVAGNRGYLLAAGLGAIGGGRAIALLTRAVPKMMSRMMQSMGAQMVAAGCDPEEM
jgi:hypothetical protein